MAFQPEDRAVLDPPSIPAARHSCEAVMTRFDEAFATNDLTQERVTAGEFKEVRRLGALHHLAGMEEPKESKEFFVR